MRIHCEVMGKQNYYLNTNIGPFGGLSSHKRTRYLRLELLVLEVTFLNLGLTFHLKPEGVKCAMRMPVFYFAKFKQKGN